MQNQKNVNQLNNGDNDTIDLKELFLVLLNKAWLLLLCCVIGCTAAGLGTKLLITPQYQATSTIYIFSKTTSITSLADIQIGAQLTVDFQIIATTREVVEQVIDELDLNTSYEGLKQTISVSNPTDSHMLTITVTNPDPVLAADISNTLANVLREQVAEVMNTDKPSTVEKAVVPSAPSSPSLLKNTVSGGAVCVFAVAAIIVLLYLLDDTVKTDEDVRKYLGLETLAAIPYDRSSQKAEGRNKKKARRSSGAAGKRERKK